MPPRYDSTKLTPQVINAARRKAMETGKRVAVWDGGDGAVKGFGVRISADGKCRYVFRYRTPRYEQRELTLGVFPTLPPTSARTAASAARNSVDAGADPVSDRNESRTAETMADAFPRWLTTREGKLKPSTLAEYRRQWDRDIVGALGKLAVQDVNEAHIQRLHSGMQDRKTLANRIRAVLSAFFNWTEREKLRPRRTNPAEFVETYRERRGERFLQSHEYQPLFAALDRAESEGLPPAPKLKTKTRGVAKVRKSRAKAALPGAVAPALGKRGKYERKKPITPTKANPRAIDAIRFLLFSGWRESEALFLRWDALDLERGTANLQDTKTNESWRSLPALALEIIERQPKVKGNPYVFPGAKDGEPLKEIRHVWYAVRHAADLDEKRNENGIVVRKVLRLHDLRHSNASMLADGGSSLLIIGKALGHRHHKSTERYSKLSSDPVREAQDNAAERVKALGEGRSTPVTPLRGKAS